MHVPPSPPPDPPMMPGLSLKSHKPLRLCLYCVPLSWRGCHADYLTTSHLDGAAPPIRMNAGPASWWTSALWWGPPSVYQQVIKKGLEPSSVRFPSLGYLCLFICYGGGFLKTLRGSFRFTAKLRGMHRDFPYHPCPPHIHNLLPLWTSPTCMEICCHRGTYADIS